MTKTSSVAFAATMLGITGYIVRVEAEQTPGTPGFGIIGLPNRSLADSRERVRYAIEDSGFSFPDGHVLVNISPADIRWEGRGFDLPIALALLSLNNQINPADLLTFVTIGEINSDGRLRGVPGALPMVAGAKRANWKKVIVPSANGDEAAAIPDVEVYTCDTLRDVFRVITGDGAAFRRTASAITTTRRPNSVHGEMADIRGQHAAKRVLEIAAAGGHNVLFVGQPGSGANSLARALASISPPLTDSEALDVSSVYSIRGLLGHEPALISSRPYRFPHHSISQPALLGGGNPVRPGELSLASHGVMFLEDLPKFARSTAASLRDAVKNGYISIASGVGTFGFPAEVQLVASLAPCPCGARGSHHGECSCDSASIARYLGSLDRAFLEQFDLQIELGRVPFDLMVQPTSDAETSATIQERVIAARTLQAERYGNLSFSTNNDIPNSAMREFCALDDTSMLQIARASSRRAFSARTLDRIIRVARTIADLAGATNIESAHIAEAIEYRSPDLLTPTATF